MYSRNYFDGMIPTEEFFFVVVIGDESRLTPLPDADLAGYEYLRNEECMRKMREPIVCNGNSLINTPEVQKTLVQTAWYFEAAETEENGYWDEASIRKMREPTGHGHPIFMNRVSLDRLATML